MYCKEFVINKSSIILSVLEKWHRESISKYKDFVLYEIIISIISVNGDLNLPTSFNLTLAQNYCASSHGKTAYNHHTRDLFLKSIISALNRLGGLINGFHGHCGHNGPSCLWNWPNVFCINKYFYPSSKPWQSTSWLLTSDLLLMHTQIYNRTQGYI